MFGIHKEFTFTAGPLFNSCRLDSWLNYFPSQGTLWLHGVATI